MCKSRGADFFAEFSADLFFQKILKKICSGSGLGFQQIQASKFIAKNALLIGFERLQPSFWNFLKFPRNPLQNFSDFLFKNSAKNSAPSIRHNSGYILGVGAPGCSVGWLTWGSGKFQKFQNEGWTPSKPIRRPLFTINSDAMICWTSDIDPLGMIWRLRLQAVHLAGYAAGLVETAAAPPPHGVTAQWTPATTKIGGEWPKQSVWCVSVHEASPLL